MKSRASAVSALGGVLLAVACSTSNGSGFGDAGSQGPITVPTGDGSAHSGSGTGTMTLMNPTADGGPGSGVSSADGGPCTYASTDTTDHDGDGWAGADGDCNDCNKFINPGAYDIEGNGIDEDCNGVVDDEPAGCDASLTSVATTSGADGAKAMDLCRTTADGVPLPKKTWGVVSASYVTPDGASSSNANFPLGFGILGPKYGSMNSVQKGSHALGLSSGTARQPTDPGYKDVCGFAKGYQTAAPTGFPGQTPACMGVTFGPANDGAALRVVIRVPTNALTMSFDSNFFSYEFPDFVCSPYNDTYVVIMSPDPAGEPPTANHNIAFDSAGNIISVNAGLLSVCDTNSVAGGKTYPCAEGPAKLAATGFGVDSAPTCALGGAAADHASTDWLTTTVDVSALAGKDITLLFAIWDSTDGILDSTVLVDDVHWTFATAPDQVPPPPAPPVTAPK